MNVPEHRTTLGGTTLLLAVTLASSASLTGCAHFCQDAYQREGAWGAVFRCSSRHRSAVSMPEAAKASVKSNRTTKVASLPGDHDEQLREMYFPIDCSNFVDATIKQTSIEIPYAGTSAHTHA